MTKINTDEFAQTLRRSHCSKPDRDHDCVGTCKVTPQGVELACNLCGTDSQPLVPPHHLNRHGMDRLKRLFQVAGMDFACLSAEVQRKIILEAAKTYCPGCHVEHSVFADHVACPCGDYSRSDYRGWTRTSKKILEDQASQIPLPPSEF